jgi:hypothetical protein
MEFFDTYDEALTFADELPPNTRPIIVDGSRCKTKVSDADRNAVLYEQLKRLATAGRRWEIPAEKEPEPIDLDDYEPVINGQKLEAAIQ